MKRVYTQPWTARSAKINVAVWTVACGVAVVNFGMGMMAPSALKWLWFAINPAILFFDIVMLKWSVTGLLWRKAEDAKAAAQEEFDVKFYNLVLDTYKRS